MAVLYPAESQPYNVISLYTTPHMSYPSRLFWEHFLRDWSLQEQSTGHRSALALLFKGGVVVWFAPTAGAPGAV